MRAKKLGCWIVFALSMASLTALDVPPARAQSALPGAPTRLPACLDTLSLKPRLQTLVYVRARFDEAKYPALREMVELFAQSISQHIRHVLHGQGSVLPHGEPAITWRTVGSDDVLEVTIHREGPAGLRVVWPLADSTAAVVMLTATKEAIAAGEGTYWPGDAAGDSMQFRVGYVLPAPGEMFPFASGGIAFPAFAVNFPPFTPAVIESETAPAYPATALEAKATGTVTVDFEVDSTGHVARESIRNVQSPEMRQSPMALAANATFFESVRNWLPTTRFTPAHIGGCPVSQQMRKPITFDLP
ncbi:MAG: energy transducer TonB [Gemmatimonadaceae bacterium]